MILMIAFSHEQDMIQILQRGILEEVHYKMNTLFALNAFEIFFIESLLEEITTELQEVQVVDVSFDQLHSLIYTNGFPITLHVYMHVHTSAGSKGISSHLKRTIVPGTRETDPKKQKMRMMMQYGISVLQLIGHNP